MQDFKKLKVWELAHELTLELYKMTDTFPKKEEYRITSQLIRAMTSVPTNIAEGCGHESKAEFKRYLSIAIASITETEYLIILARDRGYMPINEYNKINEKLILIRKMLITFKRKI
ncbi:MAG: four helix bundle protein [Candidatus Dojkabacteria bacterium]|nr:four helix bundle protein [Candidatus Dojkabacteria bacterium]MDQ7021236.1 four helix bundle protein [Candidatus Dojkabacteria bacterium]